MTQFATGVFKQLYLAQESTEGVIPTSGARTMRRVTADFSLSKDSYPSREIRPSMQTADARHGVRRATGTYQGQLSPGSYFDIFQGLLRGTWTAGVSFPSLATVSVTVGSGNPQVATINNNSHATFQTSGMKVGDVVAMTGFTGAQAVLNGVPMRVTDISDLSFNTLDLPTAITASFSANNISIAVVGSKLIAPATGQVDRSYSIEQWFSDVGQSEVYVGMKPGQVSLNMPATGMIDVSATFTGIDMVQGTSQALTGAKAPTTSNSLAAVDGTIYLRNLSSTTNAGYEPGAALATITGMNLQISRNLQANPVAGTNVVPHVFTGNLTAQGSMTVMFQDQTFLNLFLQEDEMALGMMLTTTRASQAPDFVSIYLPRIKIMSSNKSDSDMSLIASMNFMALENTLYTTSDDTTVMIQDSTIVAGF